MAIIQEAFDIPADLAAGIATGKLSRIGGVVRVAQGEQRGQIVKLLDPVSTDDQSSSAINDMAEATNGSKEALIIIGVAVAVIVCGAVVYSAIKKHEPKEMKTAREKLDDYLTAIRKGNVSFLVVDQLIKALDNLKEVGKHKKITFQLTPEELGSIISQIAKYTNQLASLNNYSLSESEQEIIDSPRAEVFDLKKYLEIQRNIIVEATEV